ncbi:MAG TPA: hypothetical protein VJ948_07595 [Acidimicrobiia bacterium]|nr:hypothetical protein [Acidimicrobiia bacterium]
MTATVTVPTPGTRCVETPSRITPESSKLVEVLDPTLVEVVERSSALVDVVSSTVVGVDEATVAPVDDEESTVALVAADPSKLAPVVGVSTVAPAAADESTEALVELSLVIDVELASFEPAQATPTTASAATTAVNTPNIFLIMGFLLG